MTLVKRLRPAGGVVSPPIQAHPYAKERHVLQPVGVGHKTLADYTHLVGRPLIEEVNELAEELKGLKVLHLSATAFGGGVSEILYTLVPLMRDVGIEAEWQVIIGREEFFNATKLMHNALQGNPLDLSPSEWKVYEEYNEINARLPDRGLGRDHRPRPAAAVRAPARAGQVAPLDLALPHRPLDAAPADDRAAGRRTSREYDGSVFHLQEYVPAGVSSNNGGGPGAHLPAGDRPAVAEEHGAVARGRRVRVRPVRHRRRPAADVPGVALRPVEGPARRDRRLPAASPRRCPRCSSRSSARWPPTTPRAGSSSTRRSSTRPATRTSRSSTT